MSCLGGSTEGIRRIFTTEIFTKISENKLTATRKVWVEFFFPLSFYSVDSLSFGWVSSLLICNTALLKQIKLLEQIQLQNVLLQSRADTGFCNTPLLLTVYLGELWGLEIIPEHTLQSCTGGWDWKPARQQIHPCWCHLKPSFSPSSGTASKECLGLVIWEGAGAHPPKRCSLSESGVKGNTFGSPSMEQEMKQKLLPELLSASALCWTL